MTGNERHFRLRVIQAGVGVTLGLAAAGAAYVVATWHEPNRGLLALIMGLAALDGVAIGLARHRLARLPRVELFFVVWNVAHIAAAAAASLLDGGPASPFVLVLFVSVAFAAVSLDRRYVVGIAALDVVALLAIAAGSGSWPDTLLFTAASLVTIAVVCAAIAGERQERLVAVQDARAELLRRLARVIEYRDTDTGQHIERMSEYCGLIARRLGWPDSEVEQLRLAATMHDIGKVAVHDEILLKQGPLTDEERREMERHTVVGHEMLSGSTSDEIELAALIALTHHERFDGTGYPQGLSGADIPPAGRIVAVADVFDALTSDRVYRGAMPIDEALATLDRGRATHFDPRVLDAFHSALDEILSVRSAHREVERRRATTTAPIPIRGAAGA